MEEGTDSWGRQWAALIGQNNQIIERSSEKNLGLPTWPVPSGGYR